MSKAVGRGSLWYSTILPLAHVHFGKCCSTGKVAYCLTVDSDSANMIISRAALAPGHAKDWKGPPSLAQGWSGQERTHKWHLPYFRSAALR